MHERAYVVPEDVQYLFSAVVSHRVIAKGAAQQVGQDALMKKILAMVSVVNS